ncbi:MAG TPA: ATP-binding protein [Thermoanaerobaculia bacterium]
MTHRQPIAWKRSDLFWVALSLLVLPPCLYYPYARETQKLPFNLLPTTWEVRALRASVPCEDPDRCLQVNDRVLSVGDVEFEEFRRNRYLSLIDSFKEDGSTIVKVERNGKILTLPVRLGPGPSRLREYIYIPITAFFPMLFWLMGTTIVLFLRPRDERWRVLVLFSYVTALWIAFGLGSENRISASSVLFHVFIWLFLPLATHLHLILPSALVESRRKIQILVPLYAGSVLYAVLDYFHKLHGFEYYLSFALAVFVSLGLLIARLFLPLPPAVKIANRIMLYGVALGFGPILLFWIIIPIFLPPGSLSAQNYEPAYPWTLALTLLAVPILPMSYIYAIYKHHLGALEFRANRLLGAYSFSTLYITFYIVMLFSVSRRWAPMSDKALVINLLISLLFLLAALSLRNRFHVLVDRHVFGVRHSPEQVIDLVSERIPTAFDRAVLSQVIVAEILPSLLIRQSALYLFDGPRIETLYTQGVPADEPEPALEELQELLRNSKRYLPPQEQRPGPRSWVRLTIPLSLQAETIGIWLIGRRDPDDFYPSTDIHLLSTVANQIAPMVENIRLYERAQQEIAQRKAAEEEIRRSEERFRALFEATLEGIAIVRNGTILAVNPPLLAIFGYPPDQLIGRELSDLIPEIRAELSGEPQEHVGTRSDGTPVDVEIAGKQHVFQGEDVTVVAIRDIGGRKQGEAENKMLQKQLLHSQKMEAIGRLSAGVAHDFNNCLLAIFGYSDLLRDRYREDPFLYRNLTGIKEAGQKAATLTKQLLAFARRQPLETRVLDLNPIVSGLEKMLQRLLGEDIALVTDLHHTLGKVKIDPGQMEQVIVNLAVNARDAMPTGGRLTIRTTPLLVTSEYPAPHANVPPGLYVVLTVADTGFGMDAETQARIFEPFFSTKGDGTGLGLSTAYGIVQQSRGHIFVDSAPGRGASFSIYLPVTQEAESVAITAAGAPDDSGTETILLVEDEDEVRKVLHQILTGKGYRVIQAGSGEEALAMTRLYRGEIHLLLSDVTMPRMRGPELASRLLGERPRTRVILMSGYNDEWMTGGEMAHTCLQKPFSPQVLTQMVRAALDTRGSEPPLAVASA